MKHEKSTKKPGKPDKSGDGKRRPSATSMRPKTDDESKG